MKKFKRINRILSNTPICGIYLITNIINNKCYVGNSIDIERRWLQHKYGSGSKLIAFAIKKYGKENFKFEVIEELNTINKDRLQIEDELIILEQKWLDIKKSYDKGIGYNLNKSSKPNLTKNRNKDFGKKISRIKIENNHCGKAVIQYDLNRNFIKEWKSAAQIERELNFKAECISACCLHKRKTMYGFLWIFKGENINPEYNVIKRNRKRIVMLTINGKLIKEFDSISQASKEMNINHSGIRQVCNGKYKHAGGYKWEFI